MTDIVGAFRIVALVGLGVAGAFMGVRGVRLFVRAARRADEPDSSLWLIRGIRGIVVAVGAGALGAGLVLDVRWLTVFGVVFLAEELYETGVVALVLRAGRQRRRA